MEIIRKENMRIHLHANSWQDALYQAGMILVEDESIKKEYIDAMVQSIETHGPYIVLMPGFALAHAEPSEHVLKTEMALAVFDEEIDFHSINGPVRLIVVLASLNKTSHLERLAAMASKMMDDETLIERIIHSKSIDEISGLINDELDLNQAS